MGQTFPKEIDHPCGYMDHESESLRGYEIKIPTNASSYADGSFSSELPVPHHFTLRNFLQFSSHKHRFDITSVAVDKDKLYAVLRTGQATGHTSSPHCVTANGVYEVCSSTATSMIHMDFPTDRPDNWIRWSPGNFQSSHSPVFEKVIKGPAPLNGTLVYGVAGVDDMRNDHNLFLVRYRRNGFERFFIKVTGVNSANLNVAMTGASREIVVAVMNKFEVTALTVQDGTNRVETVPMCSTERNFMYFLLIFDSETGALKRHRCIMAYSTEKKLFAVIHLNTMITDTAGNIYMVGLTGAGTVFYKAREGSDIIADRPGQYAMMIKADTEDLETGWLTWVLAGPYAKLSFTRTAFMNRNDTSLLFLLHTNQDTWDIIPDRDHNASMLIPPDGNFYIAALDPSNGRPQKVSLLGSKTLEHLPEGKPPSVKLAQHSSGQDAFYMCFFFGEKRRKAIFLRKFTDDGQLLAERMIGRDLDGGYIEYLHDFDIYEDDDGVTHVSIVGTWKGEVYFGVPLSTLSNQWHDVFIAHYTEGCSCEKPNCRIPTCRGAQTFSPRVCSSRGICEDLDMCRCHNGYDGIDCELNSCFGILSNDTSVCNGYGTCVAPDVCRCQEGRLGEECELFSCHNFASTSERVCSSGRGTCVSKDQCRCNDISWTGIECETNVKYDEYERCPKGNYRIITNHPNIVAAKKVGNDLWVHKMHKLHPKGSVTTHVNRIYVDNSSPKESPHRGAVYIVGQYTRFGDNLTEICLVARLHNPEFTSTSPTLEFSWVREFDRLSTTMDIATCPEVMEIDSKHGRLFISGRIDNMEENSGIFLELLDLETGQSLGERNVYQSKENSREIAVRKSYSTFLQMTPGGKSVILAGNVLGPIYFSSDARITVDPINAPAISFALEIAIGTGTYISYSNIMQLGSDMKYRGSREDGKETIVTAVQVASNGDIIMVGYWRYETVIGTETYTSDDLGRGFIVRYSYDKNKVVWKIITVSATETSRLDFLSAQVDQFDNLYVFGTAFGSVTIDTLNENMVINSTSTRSRADGDPFVMRVDSNGNVVWLHRFARHFDSSHGETFQDISGRTGTIVLTREGSLFVTFGVRGSIQLVSDGPIEESKDRFLHMHIAKMHMLTGHVVWTKTLMNQLQQSSSWGMAYREDDSTLIIMGSYNSEKDVVIARSNLDQRNDDVVLPKSSILARENVGQSIESPMDPFILVIRDSYCKACPMGHFESDEKCVPCGNNEYQTNPGQYQCEQCPPGTMHNRLGSTSPGDCVPCSPGSSRNVSEHACTPCAFDKYAPRQGMTQCYTCPMGLSTWIEGADGLDHCLILPMMISLIALAVVAVLICTCAFFFMRYKLRRSRTKEKTELEMALLGDGSSHGSTAGSISSHGPQLIIDHSMFELSFSEFSDLNEIASGGSGAVIFTANWQKQKVVLKIWRLSPFQQEEEYGAFESEIRLLSSIRSQYVVNFLGAILELPRVGIALEYCSKGSLYQLLRTESLSWSKRLRILQDVTMGMIFLHSRSIIHRDLKSDNVLIDRNYQAKVSDFGCSKRLDLAAAQQHTKNVGTSVYMAPEVTNGEQYNEKCDVFSFAIILFEVVTLLEPYQGIPKFNIEAQVAKRPDLRPQIPDDAQFIHDHESRDRIGDQMKLVEMMKHCWQHDPDERPSFNDILALFEDLRENVI